jgi:glycosyltransferase involved in cell wall biosynthesis
LHIGYNFNPFETGRGGVVIYQWGLIKALKKIGWDISFLSSSKHTLSKKLKTDIYHLNDIKIIDLVNSPRRHLDFACNPLDHLENQIIEAVTGRILGEEEPVIVHIHDPRLFTASIIDVLKGKGIPVVKTIHNYFDVCPQGELMFKGKSLCTNYKEGSSCVQCLSYLPQERFLKEQLSDTLRGSFIHPIMKKVWQYCSGFLNNKGSQRDTPIPFPPDSYRTRRQFLIKRLQMLDAIHCSSRRAAEILIGYGVKEEKIMNISITSSSVDMIKPKPFRSEKYPVVFGYLTGESYIKGYTILLDAFSKLDQKKATLIAYGFKDLKYYRNKYKHLNAEFYGPYHINELNEIMSRMDVGIIPSIWEEVFGIVGLEFLSAGVPVIGSFIGGITEWLKDGENGFLFQAGDSNDLVKKMELFVNNPGLISQLQRNIRPWKSMEVHAHEISAAYQKIISPETSKAFTGEVE